MKMKKIYFLLGVMLSVSAMAQQNPCTPLGTNQDSLFGLWPDTTQNLPAADAGVYYETTVQLKTPTTAGEVPSVPIAISSYTIDSIALIETVGLPTGMSMACSEADCVYEGDTIGCVDLFGTTSDVGVHDLSFKIDGWATVPIIGTVISLSGTPGVGYMFIDGYKLVVNGSSDMHIVKADEFQLLQNVPNPFTQNTTIRYNLMNTERVSFEVYSLLGNRVYANTYEGVAGTNEIVFNASELSSGIYYYSLSNGSQTLTNKMLLQRNDAF
jgi:hypothetical protein